MKRDEAIAKLKEHEAELRKAGVRSLFIFGSTARDQARPTSDVDLFFDYDRGLFDLFDLMKVKRITTEILGQKADIMTRDSLHPMLKSRIESSSLRVF